MMAEQVKPDTFRPPHHKLQQHIEAKLETLLKEKTLISHKIKLPLEQHL